MKRAASSGQALGLAHPVGDGFAPVGSRLGWCTHPVRADDPSGTKIGMSAASPGGRSLAVKRCLSRPNTRTAASKGAATDGVIPAELAAPGRIAARCLHLPPPSY